MKITPELMSACVRDFKLFGTLTYPFVIRRHKVSVDMAVEICNQIAKRFPNLWRDRDENKKKYNERIETGTVTTLKE